MRMEALYGGNVKTVNDAHEFGVRVAATPGKWAWAYLTPSMARALAADLLAFADSVEPATESETT